MSADVITLPNDPTLQKLFALYAKKGFELRLVGGCVRDLLLNRPMKDIDLASNAIPQETLKLLGKAKIKAVETGVAHGTVTAVLDGKSYEITTLRSDTKTDGRHAVVVFGKDWQQDAQRRDFTINALSADAQGKLHDYTGGRDDLAARTLRFIGEADTRVREDYLRILRFFRFAAQLGWTADNAEALQACAVHRDKLSQLSRERLQQEMDKILLAEHAIPVLQIMQTQGIFEHLLPFTPNIDAYVRLCANEQQTGIEPQALRRMLALSGWQFGDWIEKIRVLTRGQRKHLQLLEERLDEPLSDWRQDVYRHGQAVMTDVWLAHGNIDQLQQSQQFAVPEMPLRAGDFMMMTGGEGLLLGTLFHAVEDWWVENLFQPGKKECLAYAAQWMQENVRYIG